MSFQQFRAADASRVPSTVFSTHSTYLLSLEPVFSGTPPFTLINDCSCFRTLIKYLRPAILVSSPLLLCY